jgi:1-aminocyclopropane-1-carboxylate deaminase/D-cysteine desulfhydrase-like pyridoxal-dependent ACC family enzyme
MAGLIGHAHEGRFGVNDVVVFLHTGGSPALFAYNQETAASLQAVSR